MSAPSPQVLGDGLGMYLQEEEPREGLGSCFPGIFQPLFAPRNAPLAGGQQERGLCWELGMAWGVQDRNLGQGLLQQQLFWLCPRSPALASAPSGAEPALGVWDTGLCFGE